MTSLWLRLALAVVGSVALAGCAAEATPIGPYSAPTPSDLAASRVVCASFVYPTLRTTRVTLAPGACVSFARYSDSTAVITGIDVPARDRFESVDGLTYRAVLAGTTVVSIYTKREICTATATCQVANPVKQLTVTVTKAD